MKIIKNDEFVKSGNQVILREFRTKNPSRLSTRFNLATLHQTISGYRRKDSFEPFYETIKNKISKYLICFFIIIISNCSHNIFENEPNIRVRILNTADKVEMTLNGDWQLSCRSDITNIKNNSVIISVIDGKIIMLKNGNRIEFYSDLLFIKGGNNGTVDINKVPYGVGWWWEGKEDRTYEGEICLHRTGDKLEVIVKLPMEEYLKGVIPYEMCGNSPIEALKSQAVAARSEAVIALTSEMYCGEFHDLTSDVECQVFSGNRKRTALSDQAVMETRGIILTENGEPINAYYASNCGGHSELIKNVWPDRPKLQSYKVARQDDREHESLDLSHENNVKKWILSQPKVYCNPNLETELPEWSQSYFRWIKEYDIDNVSKMIASDEDLGELLDIKVLKRGVSGRIYSAEFIFKKGSIFEETELDIRMRFNPSLRSSCFIVNKEDGKFILKGAGWGHGVGMCQSGAVCQAKQGLGYISILKHYYSEANLVSLYK